MIMKSVMGDSMVCGSGKLEGFWTANQIVVVRWEVNRLLLEWGRRSVSVMDNFQRFSDVSTSTHETDAGHQTWRTLPS